MSISNTAKQGNVLVLLDLYTSGFVSSVSPTVPMLMSRTMHTLYALSCLIYVTNCICNWIHIYCLLLGYTTSFPLQLWFSVAVVVLVVTASMLIVLLLMLCIENAFIHRLDITVYKSGLCVIWEALIEWIHSFNNFRDCPITLANFFLIAPCRCAGPDVLHWPLFASTFGTLMSIIWRLIMLYYAYRRLLLPERKDHHHNTKISRQQSFRSQLEMMSQSEDQSRLSDYDETWPVRWSIRMVYGHYPTVCRPKTVYMKDVDDEKTIGSMCTYACSCIVLKFFDFLASVSKKIACSLCILLTYSACFAMGCLPCLYFYTCRSNSLDHRHKCSKTFVRYCSLAFHYSIVAVSILCAGTVIVLNLLLISSVHVIGWNQIPSEINKICLIVDYENMTIRPYISTTDPLFTKFAFIEQDYSLLEQLELDSQTTIDSHRPRRRLFCKPIWEAMTPEGSLAPDRSLWSSLGFNRQNPGPWQLRIPLRSEPSSPSTSNVSKLLVISTHLVSNFVDRRKPTHTLVYDYALLRLSSAAAGGNSTTSCQRRNFSGWTFINSLNRLNFPYFLACCNTIKIRKRRLIDCRNL